MNELELFAAAIAIADPGDRTAFLDRECPGRNELRQRLDALLSAHFRSNPLLDPPATAEHGDSNEPAIATTLDHPCQNERAGTVIAGKYTLVDVIGEGGMGSVWRARQTEPVKRYVAVKLIKVGMDSRSMLQRFEQERQALALMDHPNIAKVFDGGMTGQRWRESPTSATQLAEGVRRPSGGAHGMPAAVGQPFFVMELVNGLSLNKFCDEGKLGIPERLDLFAHICQAVQHAHQKGVIHRDLKPANILVTIIDGRPVPKVIDFGVAKAIAGKLTDESLATHFGAVVGTLEYMSPEQAGYSGEDIDTRADIYSLGVILYELLTGLRPIDAKRLKRAALHEMIRVIKEEEPSKPSTRLSTDESAPSLAALRHTEPKKLAALLRGELDWVVMKCLEKNRDRRYDTANGLARDIKRYLADEPVEARPASTGYRLKKFVSRNRGKVTAAGLVALALVAGVIGTSLGLVEARAQRDAAERAASAERSAKIDADRQRAAAEASKLLAESNAKRAITVRDFLLRDLLGQADSEKQAIAVRSVGEEGGITENPTVKVLLDRAAKGLTPENISKKFPDQLEVQAEILGVVGDTYRAIGQLDKAILFLTRADAAWKAAEGPDSKDAVILEGVLALALHNAGRLPEAIPLFEQVRNASIKSLGPDDPNTLINSSNLAYAYLDAGRRDEGIKLIGEVSDAQSKRLGKDHVDTLTSKFKLALAYYEIGDVTTAIEQYEAVRSDCERVFGLDHPLTIAVQSGLAHAYRDSGRLAKSVPLYERVRDADVRTRGADHPNALVANFNVASVYVATGKVPQGIKLFEQTRDAQVRKIGSDHPNTLATYRGLADAYTRAGRAKEAAGLLEHVRDVQLKTLSADNPTVLETLHSLGLAYRFGGRLPEAIQLFRRVTDAKVKTLGTDHPYTLSTQASLAICYYEAGKLNDAVVLLRQVAQGIEKLAFRHAHTGVVLDNLSMFLELSGALAEATTWRQKWLGVLKSRGESATPAYAAQLALFANLLLRQDKAPEAEAAFRECLTIREKTQPDSWTTFNTRSLLGGALLAQKKYAEAEPLLRSGYEGLKQREKSIPPPSASRIPEAIDRLIKRYSAINKPDEVKKWQTERAKYPQAKPAEKK